MNKLNKFVLLLCIIPLMVSCKKSASQMDSVLYELPRDGLAEVARYEFSTTHYGVPLKGLQTLVIVRENINKNNYVKTNKHKDAIEAVKLMAISTLSSMNWDDRSHTAVFSNNLLRPLRMSMTAEEWCGNNYLEFTAHGEKVSLIGRPYTDELGHVTKETQITPDYYLYEQIPILVRAIAKHASSKTLRVMAQQTAYLLPHEDILTLKFERIKEVQIRVPAGQYKTVLVEVSSTNQSKYFPETEKYWLEKNNLFIVKAIRNEVHTQFGKFHVSQIEYHLLKHQRSEYWQTPLGPARNDIKTRQRATHSSYTWLNMARWMYENKNGKLSSTTLKDFVAYQDMPKEYLSSAGGNNHYSHTYNGQGGWYFDFKEGIFKVNYQQKN